MTMILITINNSMRLMSRSHNNFDCPRIVLYFIFAFHKPKRFKESMESSVWVDIEVFQAYHNL